MQVGHAGITGGFHPPQRCLDPQPAQADLTRVGDHHGVGTQAAVSHATLVGGLQGATDLQGHHGGLLGTPALRQQIRPGIAHDPFRDDSQVALLFDDVQDPHEAPVVDAGGTLGSGAQVVDPGVVQRDEAGTDGAAQGGIGGAPQRTSGVLRHEVVQHVPADMAAGQAGFGTHSHSTRLRHECQ